MLLTKWRDWLRARLVNDWQAAHRYWSVRLAAIGAAIQAFVTAFPTMATEAWNALPSDMRSGLPATIIKALPFVLFAMIIFARVTKQKASDDGK